MSTISKEEKAPVRAARRGVLRNQSFQSKNDF